MKKEGLKFFQHNLKLKYSILNENKRGLSTVVATLVIILLVLVAVGIIWAVISNVIEGGAEQVELSSLCNQIGFETVRVSPVEGQDGNYSVTLERSSTGEEINGAKVLFFNSSNIASGPLEFGGSLEPLESKTETVDTSQGNIVINANRFDIAPYFLDDNGNEQLCPRSFSYTLGSSGSANPIGDDGDGESGEGGEEGNETGEGDQCVDDTECNDGFKCESGECVALCDGTWEQVYYEEDVYECDEDTGGAGCDLNQCTCETGFTPDESGDCTLNDPVNEGTIFSVWPESGDANRFQSEDLPKSQSNLTGYTSYSINFTSSSETRCFGISSALYYEDLNRSELGLNIPVGDNLANITSSEGYSVWEASNCGQ
ncbi:MAG: hypothetical protein WDZ62_00080 [Candidatus Pacearchaeota archaeon]